MSFQAQQIYQQNEVNTATPQELTLMLYKGGIKFLRHAKRYIDEKDFAKASDMICKAQDILSELELTLNRDFEISKQLSMIYSFMKDTLIAANIEKNKEKIDLVISFFTEFKETWEKAMEILKNGK